MVHSAVGPGRRQRRDFCQNQVLPGSSALWARDGGWGPGDGPYRAPGRAHSPRGPARHARAIFSGRGRHQAPELVLWLEPSAAATITTTATAALFTLRSLTPPPLPRAPGSQVIDRGIALRQNLGLSQPRTASTLIHGLAPGSTPPLPPFFNPRGTVLGGKRQQSQ